MAYIKNISHEEVLHLTDQISADKGQIVSENFSTERLCECDSFRIFQR